MERGTHILFGKELRAVQIADDKKAIKFITDEGEIIAKTDGDCCSSTWIEHVSMPMGLPALIMEARDIPMPDLGVNEDQECVRYYGFELVTNKGSLVIDYRNESNGYYGGELCWPDDHFYGGVHGQNVSTEQWVDVTEDI
jgi:hypothetical protein